MGLSLLLLKRSTKYENALWGNQNVTKIYVMWFNSFSSIHSSPSGMMPICLSKKACVVRQSTKYIFLQKVKVNHLLAVMKLIDFSVLLLQLTLKTNNPVIDFFVSLKGRLRHRHCM